jgi:hypothetical protein
VACSKKFLFEGGRWNRSLNSSLVEQRGAHPRRAARPADLVCIHSGLNAGTNWVGPVEITLSGQASCTTSAADGSFEVSGASARTDFVPVTFKKDGFAPTLRTIATQLDDVTLAPQENALMRQPATFIGAPTDASKGQIAFFVATLGTGLAAEVSATATALSNATGLSGPSEPPRYLDRDGAPAVTATAGPAGGFVNVPSGFYAVQFHTSYGTCVAGPHSYSDPVSATERGASGALTTLGKWPRPREERSRKGCHRSNRRRPRNGSLGRRPARTPAPMCRADGRPRIANDTADRRCRCRRTSRTERR